MSAINKLTLVACVAALAVVGLVGAYEVKRCDNNDAIELLSFNVSACPDKSAKYCVIRLDKEVIFEAKIKPIIDYNGEIYYSTIEQKQRGGAFRTKAKIQACKDLGLECPMKAGGQYTFGNHFWMRKGMESSAYRFSLVSETGRPVMCIELPIVV